VETAVPLPARGDLHIARELGNTPRDDIRHTGFHVRAERTLAPVRQFFRAVRWRRFSRLPATSTEIVGKYAPRTLIAPTMRILYRLDPPRRMTTFAKGMMQTPTVPRLPGHQLAPVSLIRPFDGDRRNCLFRCTALV
jgi:hypothetical protein